MLSNSLIGSIKFDDVPITVGGKCVSHVAGRAWVDSSGTVLEIDFDTFELDGYGDQRAIVEWDLVHFPPLSGTLDNRLVLEIARTIAADYRDDIKDLLSEQPARRQRDPGPSMEQRL
jgi:hypothetical protein